MSDPRKVPPAYGTTPRVGEGDRPYREEAGIYATNRIKGTVPLTEGEIDARIMAAAADLAAGPGPPSGPPPFMEELIATFWHRLFENEEVRDHRLAGEAERNRVAAVEKIAASERRRQFERRVRELASERKRMPKPFAGVFLTKPEALLFCLVPGFVIEVFGSAPSLDAAFELGTLWSWIFAAAISAILILAAEQLGNTLASSAGTSRRRARTVATILVALAVTAGIWAVVRLADSRATNLAYSQGSQLQLSSGGSNGHFGAGAQSGVASTSEKKGEAASAVPTSPDYGFFVPLSVLIMFTAMLFAYRIELAHDWNELARAIDEAEGEVDEAREELIEANIAEARAEAPEDEATFAAAATIEREHGLLIRWLARFETEYHRFCAAMSKAPGHLVRPPVPDPVDILERVDRTSPKGARAPGAGGAHDQAHSGNGAGPNGGDPGAGGGPASAGEGGRDDPGSPTPHSEDSPGGRDEDDDDGSPRGFAFGG